jgi:hypothetical protein
LPAYADRSNVAGTQPPLSPSMPLPSAALVIEPGIDFQPVPSSTCTKA